MIDATLHAVFLLGTGLVFGGTAVLSFAVAPLTFRLLPADQADRVFGRILAAFDRIGLVAAAVAALAAGAGGLLAGQATAGLVRGGLLLLVALSFAWLRWVLFPRMARVGPPPPEAGGHEAWDPAARKAFDAMHRRYVGHYAAHLLVTATALALPA